MNQPKVSIGLPVYNGEEFLAEALDSILSQDFRDYELIISDNCSKDRTGLICQKYAANDSRIRYYRAEVNQGAAWNYNRVFELARAPYFKWATHDDICKPGFLRRCVETLVSAPESVVLVFPQADFIDEHGRVLRPDTDLLDCRQGQAFRRLGQVLYRVKMANAIFGLARADALRKTRLIDKFIGSDWTLLAELALLGQLWEIPEKLFLRRDHAKGSVQANPGNVERQAWFDPSKKLNGFFHSRFPEWAVNNRLLVEYLRSVHRLPLGMMERALCYLTVPSVIYGGPLRDLGGRWKRRVKGAPAR